MSSELAPAAKTPWYKKFWGGVIVTLIVVGVAGSTAGAFGSKEEPTTVVETAPTSSTTAPETTTTEAKTTTTVDQKARLEAEQNQDYYDFLMASGEFRIFPSDYVPGDDPAIDEQFDSMRDSMKDLLSAADEELAMNDSCATFDRVGRAIFMAFPESTPDQIATVIVAVETAYNLNSEYVRTLERC